MKRWLILGIATLVGYLIGTVALLVWSGINLYEGAFGDDRE
jgi:hypothetical protein